MGLRSWRMNDGGLLGPKALNLRRDKVVRADVSFETREVAN